MRVPSFGGEGRDELWITVALSANERAQKPRFEVSSPVVELAAGR